MKRRATLLALLAGGCSPSGDLEPAAPDRAAPHFTDVTEESGLTMMLTSGEDPPQFLFEVNGNGAALIDFDRDGDADAFFPNGATVKNTSQGPGARLFENLGGLRFRDVTERAGIDFHRWGTGVSQADLDGDGFTDLFITCYGPNALLWNDAQGGFEDVTATSGLHGDDWSTSSAFGDLDLDGDLDLYVVNYCDLPITFPPPQASFLGVQVLKGPQGLPPVPDFLFENQGDGNFKDVSESSGIRNCPPSYGLGALIVDFDDDGHQDIYVGNDTQASFLFRGLGAGRFQETGVLAGIALNAEGEAQATMGIALADVDGDLRPDLFTTNFMQDSNALHQNLGDLQFEDRARQYDLFLSSRPFLSWGTGFFDFDHDSDEDLVFFNGHIYPEPLCEERGWGYHQEPVLYRREGDLFELLDAAQAGDWLAEKHCDRGAAFGDLDLDGDVDILVCARNEPVRLLRNDRDGGNWLLVRLLDPRQGHDPNGYGSRVTLRAGSATQRRWIASGASFECTSEIMAHFGLGEGVDHVDLEVRWPDGFLQAVAGVPARTHQLITRDSP